MPNAATESLISAEQLHLLGSKGQVPMRRRRQLVRRRRLQDQLCQAIRELAKNPEADWLLVHGMPGVGKTQLVADVLWEKPELCFATFGRIFWLKHCSPLPQFVSDSINIISMGQSAVSSWRMECFLAGEENPDAAGEEKGADQADASGCSAAGRGKFPQIQLMGQQLKAVLEDSMADTLLVLDGVTSAETVHFFNQYKAKNCKLLATSTSQDIFCPLDDCQLQHFHLGTDELSANELAQLAACHGIEFADNEQLLSVLARSGGNLAFLEKLFTMARGRKDIFLSLLAKFHSGLCPLPEFGCHSAYFFQSLDIPLHNCLKMIDPGIGHSFAHCSVMERHVWTPFHILSLAWPQDVTGHENEAQLRALVDQQLSTVARNSLLDQRTAKDGSHFQYRLHPITHSFLLHSLPDSNAIFQHSCHSFLVKLRRHFLTAEYLNRNEHRLLDLGRRLAGNNGSRNGRRHWNGRLENNGAEDNAAGGSTISQSILRFFSSMW